MAATVRKSAVVLIAALAVIMIGGLVNGSVALVTTHGVSMAPRIMADDLVVVRRATYEVGDVVAYRSPELRQLVLHRIIAQDGPHYLFQGDNNDFVDPEQLTQDDIIGQELLHLSGGGRWLRLLSSGPLLGAVTFVLIAFGGGAATQTQRRRRKDRRTVPSRSRSNQASRVTLPLWLHAVRQRLTELPDPLLHLAKGTAVLALAGILLGLMSWTQSTSTDAGPRTAEGTVSLSYTAQVVDSAGSTRTVTAPDSVFWGSSQGVDIAYRYQGEAATVTVDAELATPGGWRTTVRLAEPARVAAGSHEATVPVDLPALWARADAAAATSGRRLDQVHLRILPRVSLDGGGELMAEMGLTLGLLTLTFSHVGDATLPPASAVHPAGDPLAVELSTSTATSTPATLTVLRRTIGVGTARAASLAAVTLAVIIAAILAALGRRSGPTPEPVRIARTYRELLVPVLPVVVRRDGRIIDIEGIDPLAKLAQAYGVPILHWSRSGVATYLVEDDDTTYRYRTGAAAPAATYPPPPTSSWTTPPRLDRAEADRAHADAS